MSNFGQLADIGKNIGKGIAQKVIVIWPHMPAEKVTSNAANFFHCGIKLSIYTRLRVKK